MRIIVRPLLEPQREIDVTERLVAAIAKELWRLYGGGDDRLNWLEAEVHLRRIVGWVRAEASDTAAPAAGGDGSARPGVASKESIDRHPAGSDGRAPRRDMDRTFMRAGSNRRRRRSHGVPVAGRFQHRRRTPARRDGKVE